MKVQIKKWGNSLAVRIPKVFAEESNIQQASVVNVSVVDGKLVIEPVTGPAYTLEQLLAGINRRTCTKKSILPDQLAKRCGDADNGFP